MGRNTERVDATLARAAASNYWTEAEAQAVLEAYEASGLWVAEFARRHGLGGAPAAEVVEEAKGGGGGPGALVHPGARRGAAVARGTWGTGRNLHVLAFTRKRGNLGEPSVAA